MERTENSPQAHLLRARFAIVTPMFLGGANQETETIRPPSIKGALRFWWRALNWSRFLRANGSDEIAALRELHKEEARLFGIAANDNKEFSGQGMFLLIVKPTGLTPWMPGAMEQSSNPGRIYTLGQGLCEYNKQDRKFHLSRKALTSGSFEVLLRFRNSAKHQDRDSIIAALRLFGLLGGLGSKTRRGWGSISLEYLSVAGTDESLPKTQQEYIESLRQILNSASNNLPPFTAFSNKTKIRLTHQGPQPLPLIEKAGEQLLRFRSNGRRGDDKKGGRLILDSHKAPKSLRFWGDHELMRESIYCNITKLPERLIFGYPYAVQFSAGGDVQLKQTTHPVPTEARRKMKNGYERRASPLLIHLQKLNGSFVLVQTLMPATFLPNGEKINIQTSNGSAGKVEYSPDWDILAKEYLPSLPDLAKNS